MYVLKRRPDQGTLGMVCWPYGKQARVTRTDREIEQIQEFMKEHESDKLEYSDDLVRRYINSVTVYHGRFHFEFKAGLETDVWREN